MVDDRRLDILRAIVEDYVATHEPVGSRSLVERHQLNVSAATVRNDMAVLEDEGYISQPHTSAGRIPTDKGYRLFVDRLATVKALSVAERRAIDTFMNGAVDLDDVLRRSVRLLAQLTRQVAIVQYPSLDRAHVLRLDVIGLDGNRVLVICITSNGGVEQRTVELDHEPSEADLDDMRRLLSGGLAGHRLAEVEPAAGAIVAEARDRSLAEAVVGGVRSMAAGVAAEHRFAVGGTANLARFGSDFDTTIRPVLEVLEEQVVLLKLLGDVGTDSTRVTIGEETGLTGTAVVAAGYGAGSPIATLGTVGPTRMDYPATMAAVAAVARYVGRLLADG
jgi:heat-inducible transcriptional repressor